MKKTVLAILTLLFLNSCGGDRISNRSAIFKSEDYQEAIAITNDDLEDLFANSQQAKIDNSKWAFIIGVEHYDETADIPFSKRSAEMFAKVAHKNLGIPKRNIYSLIDEKATTTAIKDKMRRMLENVKEGDTIYFYYSGHGVPNRDGKAYILPKDKMVDYVSEDKSLQLEKIYLTLTNSKASKVVAFVDSCFSGRTGAKKDETLFKNSGVAGIYAKKINTKFDKKKMVVMTAGKNNQFSNMYRDKGHRLFSYFLMKEIIKGEKNIDILHSVIKTEVYRKSNQFGDNYRQIPQIDGNRNLEL